MSQAAEKVEATTTEIAVYKPFWQELEKLKADNSKLVFQYHTPKGNKEARSHIYNLRKRKADIERARKAEKQEALEYGRQVDAQAKEIAAEYEAIILTHQKPLDEIERKEAERVAAIESRIESLTELASFELDSPDSQLLAERLSQAEAFVVDASLEEFQGRAETAKTETVEKLGRMLEVRKKYESEQAELERLRAEQAEREKREHEERIAREAEERAKREAEARAQREREEAEQKAKAEREAAERRERELREAAERAEQEKSEAEERAKRAAQEAEDRVKREAEEARRREQEEAERREANKRHKAKINNAAVAAVVAGGMEKEQAKLAVTLIAKRMIPAVTISY